MAERKRSSVTTAELAAQMGKLNKAETAESDALTSKDKPDVMDLVGAKKRLSVTQTAVKLQMPSAKDIETEKAGETAKVANAALSEKRGSLKSADTTVKQQLPSTDDIKAEKSAETSAGEILVTAKKRLSVTKTAEKSALPTADDIAAEKKDKDCAVISSADLAQSKIDSSK